VRILHRVFIAALAATTLAFGAASAKASDILDTAVSAGDFTTLVTAVKAAGLVEILKGDGPFTVFAPNDEAFTKLPAGTVEELLKPENKEQLVAILTYHIVPGKIMSGDIYGKMVEIETIYASPLSVDATDGVKVVYATVVSADIEASNGVIHVINRVVLPE
jgi:uncharacterized surface protein with fasciclin (FAS1) repeats